METLFAEDPIFIVGAGRSGTTLMRSLLSAHPRLAIPPETHFMKRAEHWTASAELVAPPDFETFWANYVTWVRFIDLGVDADRCRAMIEQQGEPTFKHIFRALLAAYAERLGKPRVGEKTPGHVKFLPKLFEWFPNARVVVMQRDPRAVIASQMQTPWVTDHLTPCSLRHGLFVDSRAYHIAWHAREWSQVYEQIVPRWQADPRVLVVSYEDLVRDVERGLRRVCAFVGETFEPAMVSDRNSDTVPIEAAASGADAKLWPEWRQKHYAQTLRPVSTDSIEKWRSQLAAREVAMIEGRCRRGMRKAGYAPITSIWQRSAGAACVPTALLTARAEAKGRAAARRVKRLLPAGTGMASPAGSRAAAEDSTPRP